MSFVPTAIDEVFVEIGSSEEHWGRTDAAEVWANVLTRCGRDSSARERNQTTTNDVFPPRNGGANTHSWKAVLQIVYIFYIIS